MTESLETTVALIAQNQLIVLEKLDEIKADFKEHKEDDKTAFNNLNVNVSSLYRYGGAIAIVSGFISACVTAIVMNWKSLKEFMA